MIFGHGIDLQEISAVKRAYDRNPRFAKKLLTPKEWERFEGPFLESVRCRFWRAVGRERSFFKGTSVLESDSRF